MNCYLMAGPTAFHLAGQIAQVPEVVLLPPARRGSVRELAGRAPAPACLALVDGTFHSQLAVGHRELDEAMRQGWIVWGLSSMGAIRAAEMQHMGMRGYGSVFKRFLTNRELPDDEVALLHGIEPPYRPLTEPLVHLQAAVEALVREQALPASAGEEIVDRLRQRWFGERTLPLLRSLVRELAGDGAEESARHRWADFEPYRLKDRDLSQFLACRPWRDS